MSATTALEVKTVAELAQMGVPRLQPMDATDTAAAFREAKRLLQAQLGNLQDCPAPLVCHMTDGEYNSGGDPEPIAREIMQMSVPDGNVLVENIFSWGGIGTYVWSGIFRLDIPVIMAVAL